MWILYNYFLLCKTIKQPALAVRLHGSHFDHESQASVTELVLGRVTTTFSRIKYR